LPRQRESLFPLLPLYLGELLMLLTGVAAVNLAVEDPAFAQATTLMSLVAVMLGLGMRLLGVNREYLLYVTLAVSGLALLMPSMRFTLASVLAPFPAVSQPENAIATAMLWLAIASAAGATTSAATAFVAVPLTTAFAMVAQVSIGDQFFALLMIFALLGLFQVSYEHLLTNTEQRQRSVERDFSARAVRVAVLFASLFCSVAFVGASVGARSAALVSSGALRRTLQNVAATGAPRRTFPRPTALPVSYPQGAGLTLGEPLTAPSRQLLMTVQAERASLWRGAAYDYYTGAAWRASSRTTETGRSMGDWAALPEPPEGLPTNGTPLHQRVRIIALRSNALFAAPLPIRLKGEFWSFEVRPYGTIEMAGETWPGMTYEVDSLIPDATPDVLRRAGEDYPPSVTQSYLQLPNSAWGVREVAQAAAKGHDNAYDKVTALQRYLEEEFVYTFTPPRAPQGVDRTVWFLTRSHRGYCDLFASSLALMARSLGIPARVATGFATGEESRSGVFEVRALDAHAWAEVYFPGSGWVAFDPTPTRTEEGAAVGGRSAFSTLFRWLRFHLRFTRPNLVILVTMLIAVVLLFQTSLQGAARELGRRLFGPPFTPAERIVRAYAGAERLLRRAGLPRESYETPREHCGRVETAGQTLNAQAAQTLGTITALLEECCYAKPLPAPSQADQAQQALRTLRTALRRKARAPRKPH